MPVCSGSCTDLRAMTPGACSSSARRVSASISPRPSIGTPSGSTTRPRKRVADGDREDLAGAADLLALLDAGELTEDDDTDLVDVEVQREAERAVLELQQLVGHRRGQALDVRDAVTGVADPADLFAGGRAGLVGLNEVVQCVPDLLRTDRELRHQCLFSSSSARSDRGLS